MCLYHAAVLALLLVGCIACVLGTGRVPMVACIPMCVAQIPYFNAPMFLENKTQIGKVEEILGPINNVVSQPASRGPCMEMDGRSMLP